MHEKGNATLLKAKEEGIEDRLGEALGRAGMAWSRRSTASMAWAGLEAWARLWRGAGSARAWAHRSSWGSGAWAHVRRLDGLSERGRQRTGGGRRRDVEHGAVQRQCL